MKVLRYSLLALAMSMAPAHANDPTVAGIVFQQDMFMRAVTRGMEAAGKERGITVFTANSDNKVEKEANLIDTYIARGVKAIVIAPLGSTTSFIRSSTSCTAGASPESSTVTTSSIKRS